MRTAPRASIAPPPSAKTRGVLLGVAAGVIVQGCSMARLERMTGVEPAVAGQVSVPWAAAGEVSFMPQECYSGDRANFRGVDLISPNLIMRVVAEPLEGLSVAFIDPKTGTRHAVLQPSTCAGLSGDVQRTGWRVNHIADVSGYVEIECLAPNGEAIRGRIDFEHCH